MLASLWQREEIVYADVPLLSFADAKSAFEKEIMTGRLRADQVHDVHHAPNFRAIVHHSPAAMLSAGGREAFVEVKAAFVCVRFSHTATGTFCSKHLRGLLRGSFGVIPIVGTSAPCTCADCFSIHAQQTKLKRSNMNKAIKQMHGYISNF